MSRFPEVPCPTIGAAPRPTGPWFRATLWMVGGAYVVLLGLMLFAAASHTSLSHVAEALSRPAIRHSLTLSLATATAATLLGLLVATPLAYLMSRGGGRGRFALEALLDLPHVLPPLAIGLLLLVAFRTWPLVGLSSHVIYQPAAIVVAQFVVAASFMLPALKAACDQVEHRQEELAQSLGCAPGQAFFWVTLPALRPALLTAGAVGWARCLGTFGPVLVFAGATRNKTEVLATTVYLELTAGEFQAALAVALLMVAISAAVLGLTRAAARSLGGAGGLGDD